MKQFFVTSKQNKYTGTKRQVFQVLIIYKLFKYVKEIGFNSPLLGKVLIFDRGKYLCVPKWGTERESSIILSRGSGDCINSFMLVIIEEIKTWYECVL